MRYVLFFLVFNLSVQGYGDPIHLDEDQHSAVGSQTETEPKTETPPQIIRPPVGSLPTMPLVIERKGYIGRAMSSLFESFVRNRKNFKIKPVRMSNYGGRISLTSSGNVRGVCFAVDPNGDAVTRYMEATIRGKGGRIQHARGPSQIYSAIKKCAKKYHNDIKELVVCTHGNSNFTKIGLSGMSPEVRRLITNVNRDHITIEKVRFISCLVAGGAYQTPTHIMRTLAAGWGSTVTAFDQKVWVAPGEISVSQSAHAVVVKPIRTKDPEGKLNNNIELM
jgi:hypothetical protein